MWTQCHIGVSIVYVPLCIISYLHFPLKMNLWLECAPGGQGKDAAISDYDASKPSLWESEQNKAKFVALWRKIAERYANNPWIAGYDLLNETNYTFPEGNNSQLRALYGRLTNAIREVDSNHMIVIEGNWFANDFSGLTPAWDTNMAYSFHKYWTVNDVASIQWVLDLRNNTNRPIWLGETGENSNTWFTDCIELVEKNNIGWSFWPVKKTGINNILKVNTNNDYTDLIKYWKGNAPKPAVEKAFQAVMTFANNHKFENCTIQHDVIDAMIRQPQTKDTKSFKTNTTESTVFAVDYDYGRAGYAYSDKVDANYHLSNNGNYTAWNNGFAYRNDGVDIESCSDAVTNGYHVGWIDDGEWMQYTIQSAESMTYNILLRYASESTAKVYVEVNGKRAYELARNSEVFELKPKILVIDKIDLISYELPYLTIFVSCSKGTYIRALARDIGEHLLSGAHLTALVRTRVGDATLEECMHIDDLDDFFEKNI